MARPLRIERVGGRVWAFYPADAYNYPGSVPDPFEDENTVWPDGFFVPCNYYYYYKQTDAWYGSPGFDRRLSHETFPWEKAGPPYPYFVEAREYRAGYTVRFGRNDGKTYRYIDVFAYACRHEATHGNDFDDWWDPMWVENDDPDRDALPTNIEINERSNPTHPVSISKPLGIQNWNDDQWYTLRHEPEWDANTINHQDWAQPGAQYP